ncbi:MAG: tRNA uridine-5-carboxymethylaminomethyl(34) synthesis GTPase MnmE [Desulfuromonadales bacterium]|nr:tRNA uridine-5-carboxymethylaminomethyl(34) synthesis GTPase MnmE [Desulfuromonadales bacterium]
MSLSSSTIVAPVTPPGEGGISVLRLSGPAALRVLAKVFTGRLPVTSMQPRRLYFGRLGLSDEPAVDEVLAVYMPGPHSYTGEDVVEVHCHGGNYLRRRALDLLLRAGADMAAPGEFTRRAFLNGRLDLVQAESVIDLIRARSDQASRNALEQLSGGLSRKIHDLTDRLRGVLVLLEAHIDFPDDEVGHLDLPRLCATTLAVLNDMRRLAASFDTGRVLRDGLNLLIVGRPNVGKSSLLNALLGEQRAIVTEFPGTTRDTIEESLVLGGLPVRLIDTAGLRDTADPIEQQGLDRTCAKIDSADLILLVVDSSCPLQPEDRLAARLCPPHKTILVVNKSDLPTACAPCDLEDYPVRVAVSAHRGDGLDALVAGVVNHFAADTAGLSEGEDLVLTERRHYQALLRGAEALTRFPQAAEDAAPYECLAVELRTALDALGEVTGATTADDILDQIFSRFCIGK